MMHAELPVQRLPEDERRMPPATAAFGAVYADHMFRQYYSAANGWHDAGIVPLENLSLHPAAAVLHYSQEIFEGLKAYRRKDGRINLFRPLDNCRRFNASARRMVMPAVDEERHLGALCRLVEVDARWVPDTPGSSLYLRPTMIATTPKLDLAASPEYLHYIITSPVGAYFSEGFNPLAVLVAEKSRRAVRGGVGEAKTGGNYAASLQMSEAATKQGFSQVLWLDAIHGRFVEEVGAMNICFVYEGKHIVTPALSGSILPGITRASVLDLAPELGFTATESTVAITQVVEDIACGAITEVFGCGTAAVIAPVGRLSYQGVDHVINDASPGPVAHRLHDALTAIQYGSEPDRLGWTITLEGQ